MRSIRSRSSGVTATASGIAALIALLLVGSSSASAALFPYEWSQVKPPSAFPSTFVTNVAWDPAGFEMVLANRGGSTQTYALENGVWLNLHVPPPQIVPGGQMGPYLLYDASDEYMLLVDSEGDIGSPYTVHVDTWKFLSGAWREIPTTTSPGVSFDDPPVVVYDASDGYVVLFGGDEGQCDCATNHLWVFHGGVWTRDRVSNGPYATPDPLLVYDYARNAVLLFSEFGDFGSHIWAYHGGSWTKLSPRSVPLYELNVGFDRRLNALLAFNVPFGPANFVWIWPAGSAGFSNITSETLHSAVTCGGPNLDSINYDPDARGLFCVGSNSGLWVFY